MRSLKYLFFSITLLSSKFTFPDDSSSINNIINAYYEVISGPAGFQYDSERDSNLHAEGAIITRFTENGEFQRHDLPEEQKFLGEEYSEGLYEIEVSRKTDEYGNIAHVWSKFEMRKSPKKEAYMTGINSISLFFRDGRWWIASWSTQYEKVN